MTTEPCTSPCPEGGTATRDKPSGQCIRPLLHAGAHTCVLDHQWLGNPAPLQTSPRRHIEDPDAKCGDVWRTDVENPCVLPRGHDTEHVDQNSVGWVDEAAAEPIVGGLVSVTTASLLDEWGIQQAKALTDLSCAAVDPAELHPRHRAQLDLASAQVHATLALAAATAAQAAR